MFDFLKILLLAGKHEMCYYEKNRKGWDAEMFGDRLRDLRKGHNLTQAQLAEQLEVSASAIGMYEQGRREPDNAFLAKLSAFFHVSTDYLLGIPAQRELSGLIDGFTRRLEEQEDLMFRGRPLTQTEREKLATAIRVAVAVSIPADPEGGTR